MKDCDVRPGWHPPNETVNSYGADVSGNIPYSFNARGYRGEDYKPDSRFRLCVIGDGHGFGIGLPLEQTFAYRLKQHIAAALGIDASEINLVNLSAGGVSADYCLRTMYRQIPECRFDLVVCQLPPANRTEYFDGEVFRVLATNDVTPANRKSAPIPLVAFCDYYNDFVGRSALVRNVLLMQDLLKEHGIDHVIATEEPFFAAGADDPDDDHIGWIDRSTLLVHEHFLRMADQAAGIRSAGRRTHAAFAIALLEFVGQMKLENGDQAMGERLARHAAHLKDSDPDWEFFVASVERRGPAQNSPELVDPRPPGRNAS